MIKNIPVLFLSIITTSLWAQYFQFTQFNFSTQRVNPAWVGLSRDAMVDFTYRNQKTGGPFQINTNFLSVAYPFFQRSTGQPWSGIGISLLADKSGPLFKSQEAAITYAVNVNTGRYQKISLGFKGLMRWQRINFDGLFTGAQYLQGHGFDPALDNGEIPQPFQNNFFTLSAGILWQETNRYGKLLKQIGFSFFDFNKPNPSFLDGSQDELPSTVVAHLAWAVYQKDKLTITPEAIMTHSNTKDVITGGGKFQYDVSRSQHVDLLLKYSIGRSGIAGLQLHKENFSLGISYDFPVLAKNVGNTGAVEIGLELRSPVDPKSRRSLSKNKNYRKSLQAKRNGNTKKTNTRSAKSNDGATKSAQTKPPKQNRAIEHVDSTAHKISSIQIIEIDTAGQDDPTVEATAGKISHEPFLVEKITLHFRFDYNSIDLDEETELFLHELSQTLKDNEKLSVQITGHTDNVGSAHLNQRLSLKRAEAVKSYLQKEGIESSRISTNGKGLTEPLNENKTEEEREINRRVEIKLISINQVKN